MKKLMCLVLAVAFLFGCIGVTAADEPKLTDVQKNSLNMLNYLTTLTYEINQAKNNRLYVEQVYNELLNNTNPSVIDDETNYQYEKLLDVLEGYRMVDVKRERLSYVLERNKAQAIRNSMPSATAFLSAIISADWKRMAASVAYMVIDTKKQKESAISDAEFEYIKSGWELDDEEAKILHSSRKGMFSYMVEMAGEYHLPDEYTMTEKTVQAFVDAKNNTNPVSRIRFLESNEKTYSHYGEYWLVLADSYFENGDYEECLKAIESYEDLGIAIFRKDFALAERMPIAIAAAEKVLPQDRFVAYAAKCAGKLVMNTDQDNWAMRFFAAQTYVKLYELSGIQDCWNAAYSIAVDNINVLYEEQLAKNAVYLADVAEEKVPKDASKKQQKEIKDYNKMLKEVRKTELAPVSEPLLLSCELLFAVAEKLELTDVQKKQVNGILHANGGALFLTEKADNAYRFGEAEVHEPDRRFNGKEFKVSAFALSDFASVSAVLIDADGNETQVEDLTIEKVERPDKADVMSFIATYTSKTLKKHDFVPGEKVTFTVEPMQGTMIEPYSFTFECVSTRASVKDAANQVSNGNWKDAAENAGSALSFWKDAAVFEEVA